MIDLAILRKSDIGKKSLKKCSQCKESKSTSEFYNDRSRYDGLDAKCKSCNNKNRLIKCHSIDKFTDRYKRRKLISSKKWALENPDKIMAYAKVHYALKLGKLIKPFSCEKCESAGYLNAHHKDYSMPLVVEWLCVKCHEKLHHG